MKKIVAFFILLLICNAMVYSANQVQTNLESGSYQIEAKTATIALNISENQSVTVFKDTLLFEEDFSKFVRPTSAIAGTIIGGDSVLTLLPSSMTQMPGCKAKSVKSNSNNDCNLQDSAAKFRTPIMLIPNNSLLSFHVKNGDDESKLTVRDTTFHLSENADSLKYIYLSNCSFIEFGKIDGYGRSLFIDDIKITTPREIVSHSLNGNELSLQGLIPETKYYIEILNQDLSVANTYYFTTPKQIENFNAQILNSDTVSLSWGNNETVSNLLLSVDSVVNAADDLLISKVASASNVNVVEIYNPTERDICLKDYEFVSYNKSSIISSSSPVLRHVFSERDSIKSNDFILFAYNTKVSPQNSDLIVFPCNVSNTPFLGGDDSYLILRKINETLYDTIDLFGRLKMISGEEEYHKYKDSILIRNTFVRVTHNPDNVANVYSDWEVSAYNAEALNQMLGNHTITPAIEVHNLSNTTMIAGQNSFQLTDVNFDGVYRCHIKENNNVLATTTFRMGKEISAIANGDWDNSAIWENGLKPTALDKVVLPQGVKVNIPQGVVAECAELVISSDYSTCDTLHKTEIRNNGALSVGKCVVKPCFSAYTSEGNGWTLFSLPIKIENKTRQEVAACFDIGEYDDLYYLQENYSSAASAWIPYNETIEDTNFFKQNLGYLIAYSQNKELLWQGDLFLEDELELLNNASYNSGGEGYHLCANPYPFSVKHSNFSKNNISGMWLLSPSTGRYIPYDPNESSEFIIPPFGGFMTKVGSAENLLKIHKQEISNTSKFSSFMDKLQLTFSYEGGEDEVRIYFRENVTENIDEYDVYKLFSFGSAPDLYSTYAQKDLSIVSLPLWQDSVIIPLSYKTKNAGNYGLKIGHIPENVVRAELYNDSNELLIDFVQDSSYNFISYNSDEERYLTLKLYSFDLGIVQTSEVCDFKVIQNKNLVKIISSDRVEGVVLYNTQGIEIMQSLSDEILLPKQGCYILGVKIKGQFSFCKIVYL